MTSIFQDSPIPRYLQLSDLFRQRIARGTWECGEKLPSLEALVREFGVARVTVRQAIDVLAREGLVTAYRGRGTFVTGQIANDRWLRVETSLDDLAAVYRDTQPQLLNITESTAAPVLDEHDGIAADRYFFMRRVHSQDGVPYCVISIYLDERIFRRSPEAFRRETVIPLLMSMPGVEISRARQLLTIGTADTEIARHLRIPVNSPVAEVRRVFNDARQRVIYLAEVTYRGDFIHLEMDLKP